MKYEDIVVRVSNDTVIHFQGKKGKWFDDRMLKFPPETKVRIVSETPSDIWLEPVK